MVQKLLLLINIWFNWILQSHCQMTEQFGVWTIWKTTGNLSNVSQMLNHFENIHHFQNIRETLLMFRWKVVKIYFFFLKFLSLIKQFQIFKQWPTIKSGKHALIGVKRTAMCSRKSLQQSRRKVEFRCWIFWRILQTRITTNWVSKCF